MATAYGSNSCNVSPRTTSTTPKAKVVTFVLHEARIPLRVAIYPHDATESIITTVKNFYGLYYKERAGISFEDERGNTMIARYENFVDHQSVNVRIIENPRGLSPSYNNADGYHGDEENNHYASRPTLRTSRFRSPSPNGSRGRRSTSTAIAGKKGRSRSSKTTHGDHGDSVNGYSSGDGASGSVSGKNKEPIGNTDISVENIVEGGRRKRAKLFESSELPLFAPPQMPAATSNHSFSPIRHNDSHRYPLPFSNATQNPFSNPRPLQTPPNYHNHYAASSTYATPAIDDRRARGSISYDGSGVAPGARTMLTPDPTVRSCVSEEDKDIKDVAMQLMRLQGDWNVHGRSSGSTLDDTFSGRADASCSTGTTSDCESESEDEMPLAHTKTDEFGNQSVFQTTESHFAVPQDGAEVSGDDADYEDGDGVEEGAMAAPKLLKNPKPRSGSLNGSRARSQPTSKPKAIKATKPKSKKTSANPVPMTPASMPASRKQSIVSTSTYSAAHGEEEQPDLSTKPRCQRCRKSKKGCDRQRPCGRCKDAGIPAEQCISEDEGNGRKGRYGRHMGVPVPVNKEEVSAPATLLPAALIAPAGVLGSAPNSSALDKSKKRKR